MDALRRETLDAPAIVAAPSSFQKEHAPRLVAGGSYRDCADFITRDPDQRGYRVLYRLNNFGFVTTQGNYRGIRPYLREAAVGRASLFEGLERDGLNLMRFNPHVLVQELLRMGLVLGVDTKVLLPAPDRKPLPPPNTFEDF